MGLLGIVERPGVSWGVLGCPGVIRLTRRSGMIDKRTGNRFDTSGKPWTGKHRK